MRNLGEAAPDSSQRPCLVEADSPAVSHNREKRRDTIQDLQREAVRLITEGSVESAWNAESALLETHLD